MRRLHRAVVAIEPWGILLAVVALLMAVGQFWVDYEDRVAERTVRAWQLVTTKAPGNSGKINALKYLNREDGLCFEWLRGKLEWLHGENNTGSGCLLLLKTRTPLVGIDLSPPNTPGTNDSLQRPPPGAYLHGTDLTRANLRRANLHRADLSGADLTDARLFFANLSDANLSGANLRRAKLFFANLSDAGLFRADLTRADLSGANLSGADLSGADLSGADLTDADLTHANLRDADLTRANLTRADLFSSRNLHQAQLDEACSDTETELPPGLTIQPCE